jgi:mannose-6-phosphate isomerase-like protein (cupin superfamily)
MISQRILVLFGIVLIGVGSAWSQQRGGVLKPGEGERLPGERQTFVKASPRTGTQSVEMFRDTMPPGTSTGVHVHRQADEFFYVVSGKGLAFVDGTELPVEADDIVFVPKGHDHRVKSSGPMPLELVFLVDQPGLASDFREGRSEAVARKRRTTCEATGGASVLLDESVWALWCLLGRRHPEAGQLITP